MLLIFGLTPTVLDSEIEIKIIMNAMNGWKKEVFDKFLWLICFSLVNVKSGLWKYINQKDKHVYAHNVLASP